MALDAQKVREAVSRLGPVQPVFIDPPPAFRSWLEQKNVPADVVEFLLGCAVAEDVPLFDGCGGMWTPSDIMELNDQYAEMLEGGLLAVGNAYNGDFIVIDLRHIERQAGFVCHELWEEEDFNIRELFAPVDNSLDAMVAGMSEFGLYPCDYPEALSWKRETKEDA